MLRWAAILVVWASLGGCAQTGPESYPVSGTITVDGELVEDGDILFVPHDPHTAPAGARVLEGSYAARMRPGKYRVEISALKITPETPIVMGSPMAANYLPARYHRDSELTAEVSPSGDNTFDFALTTP